MLLMENFEHSEKFSLSQCRVNVGQVKTRLSELQRDNIFDLMYSMIRTNPLSRCSIGEALKSSFLKNFNEKFDTLPEFSRTIRVPHGDKWEKMLNLVLKTEENARAINDIEEKKKFREVFEDVTSTKAENENLKQQLAIAKAKIEELEQKNAEANSIVDQLKQKNAEEKVTAEKFKILYEKSDSAFQQLQTFNATNVAKISLLEAQFALRAQIPDETLNCDSSEQTPTTNQNPVEKPSLVGFPEGKTIELQRSKFKCAGKNGVKVHSWFPVETIETNGNLTNYEFVRKGNENNSLRFVCKHQASRKCKAKFSVNIEEEHAWKFLKGFEQEHSC